MKQEKQGTGMSGVQGYRPIPLTIDDDYTFLDRGRWFRLASGAFRRFAYGVLRIYNRLFFGLRVQGRENLRGIRGGAVTICNHVNMIDCTFVGCECGRKKPYFPTLKSNLEIPYIRKLVEYLGGFPIPETPKAFRSFSRKIEEMLREGKWIHLFPEGHLVPYCTELREFKRGAFGYACRCRVPAIPFVVTYRENTGLRRLLRRNPSLDLTILPPVYPRPDADREESLRLMELCHRQMKEVIGRSRQQGRKVPDTPAASCPEGEEETVPAV